MSASRIGMRGHLPALDGLRGLAILLVLVEHLCRIQPTTFIEQLITRASAMGWVGVDLFFALSGFLITGILIDAKGADHYFRNFYLRRTLRIFPLYYGILVVLFVALPHLGALSSAESGEMLSRQGWYWSYLSNVMTAIAGSWQAIPALGFHFWSLAVEEQFYLIWPLVVWLLPTRRLKLVCVGAIAASLLIRLSLRIAGEPGIVSYVLTPTHLDPLAAGAWLAVTARQQGGLERLAKWVWPLLLGSGAGVLAVMLTADGRVVDSLGMQLLGYPLLAVASAALLAASLIGRVDSPLGHLWRSGPMGFLGRYSYALYVLHPLLVFFAVRWGYDVPYFRDRFGSQLLGQAVFAAILMAASLGVAVISWHAYEQPFLRLKSHFPMRGPIPVSATGYASMGGRAGEATKEPSAA